MASQVVRFQTGLYSDWTEIVTTLLVCLSRQKVGRIRAVKGQGSIIVDVGRPGNVTCHGGGVPLAGITNVTLELPSSGAGEMHY